MNHCLQAELERNLIVERVRAGLRRARLEGRRIGRALLEVNRVALLRDQKGDAFRHQPRPFFGRTPFCRT